MFIFSGSLCYEHKDVTNCLTRIFIFSLNFPRIKSFSVLTRLKKKKGRIGLDPYGSPPFSAYVDLKKIKLQIHPLHPS